MTFGGHGNRFSLRCSSGAGLASRQTAFAQSWSGRADALDRRLDHVETGITARVGELCGRELEQRHLVEGEALQDPAVGVRRQGLGRLEAGNQRLDQFVQPGHELRPVGRRELLDSRVDHLDHWFGHPVRVEPTKQVVEQRAGHHLEIGEPDEEGDLARLGPAPGQSAEQCDTALLALASGPHVRHVGLVVWGGGLRHRRHRTARGPGLPTRVRRTCPSYSPGMGPNMDTIRAALEQERAHLAARLDELTIGGEVDLEFDDDFADRGLVAGEQGENRALADTLQPQLDLVDRALQRIDDGTYGSCVTCGEAIAEERLAALPAADRCIVHA